MMKKIVLLALLLAPFVVSAQQVDNEPVAKKPSYKGFVSNRFWDNWFISVGAGAQVFYGHEDDKGDFKDLINPAFEIAVGKWILPAIGVRAHINGYKLTGFTDEEDHSHAVGEPNADGFYKQKWEQYHIMGDLLFNASNWIGGYRTDRFFEFVPYLGIGFMHSWTYSCHNEFTANAGLINKMRLSPAFDFNIEARATCFDGKYNREPYVGRIDRESWMFTALAGFTYKFNEREFKRCNEGPLRDEIAVLMTTNAGLLSAQDRLAQENAALANELKRAEAENQRLQNQIGALAVERKKYDEPMVVLFTLNSSVISDKNKQNLKVWAEEIKKNPNQNYIVTGYCDKATGTVKRNWVLSEERAQQVFNVLTKEFGVNPNQLKVDFKGGITDILVKSVRFMDNLSQDPNWDNDLPSFHPQRVAIIEDK